MFSILGLTGIEYPGDAALPALRKHFSFVGYWLTNPPGETSNNWRGKREILVKNDFGFLVLANGREEAKITAAIRATHSTALALGQADGAAAVAAAKREHFPAGTVIFLDQEEGGRLTDVQLGYLRGWVQAVADGGYRPGVYCSGLPVDRWAGSDHYYGAGYSGSCGQRAEGQGGALGVSGCLSTVERLYFAASSAER